MSVDHALQNPADKAAVIYAQT